MDAHTQIQDEIIRHLKASLMTSEVTEALGVSVKGVLKLVDQPARDNGCSGCSLTR